MAGNLQQLKANLKGYYKELRSLSKETRQALFDDEQDYKDYCLQIANIYKDFDRYKPKQMIKHEDEFLHTRINRLIGNMQSKFNPKKVENNTRLAGYINTKHSRILAELQDCSDAWKSLEAGYSISTLDALLREKQMHREEKLRKAAAENEKQLTANYYDIEQQKNNVDQIMKFMKDTKRLARRNSSYFTELEDSLKKIKEYADQLPKVKRELKPEERKRMHELYREAYNAANAYINRPDGTYASAERMDRVGLIRDRLRAEAASYVREKSNKIKASMAAGEKERSTEAYERMLGSKKESVWRDQMNNVVLTKKTLAKKHDEENPATEVKKPDGFSEEEIRGFVGCCAFLEENIARASDKLRDRVMKSDKISSDVKKEVVFGMDRDAIFEQTLHDGERSIQTGHVTVHNARKMANNIMNMEDPAERNRAIGAKISEGIREISKHMLWYSDLDREASAIAGKLLDEALKLAEKEGVKENLSLNKEEMHIAKGYAELARMANKEKKTMFVDDLAEEERREELAKVIGEILLEYDYREILETERKEKIESFEKKNAGVREDPNDVKFWADKMMTMNPDHEVPMVQVIGQNPEKFKKQLVELVKGSEEYRRLARLSKNELMAEMFTDSGRVDADFVRSFLKKTGCKEQLRDMMMHGTARMTDNEKNKINEKHEKRKIGELEFKSVGGFVGIKEKKL